MRPAMWCSECRFSGARRGVLAVASDMWWQRMQIWPLDFDSCSIHGRSIVDEISIDVRWRFDGCSRDVRWSSTGAR